MKKDRKAEAAFDKFAPGVEDEKLIEIIEIDSGGEVRVSGEPVEIAEGDRRTVAAEMIRRWKAFGGV